MISEWFALLLRASFLLLITGSCVTLLSRLYPVRSARWHRLAWGAVLLQGVVLVPISLTIEIPAWLAASSILSAESSETSDALSEHVPVGVSAISRISRNTPEPNAGASADSNATFQYILPSPQTDVSDAGENSIPSMSSSGPVLSAVGSADLPDARPRELSASEPNVSQQRVHPHAGSTEVAVSVTEKLMTAAGRVGWIRWLSAAWICGVIGLAGFGLAGYVILNLALLRARPARRSWVKELQNLSLELNLDRRVALDVHPVVGPLICRTPGGYRIVVPIGLWSELSSDERIAVLHHELSHLRRGDLWKSLLARLVLILHWFNPLAWTSARRFEESAEWACDAMMAGEQPARVVHLANALLTATAAREGSPVLALSATGGPLFQRVRRLVSWDQQGDTVMQRVVWGGLLCPLVSLSLFQLQFAEPATEQPATAAIASAETSEDEQQNPRTESVPAQMSGELKEIADRIIGSDQGNLKKLVALMKTPTGRIVMADRAALHAQDAAGDPDDVSRWQQFVSEHFKRNGSAFSVNPAFQAKCDEYVAAVSDAEADVKLIELILKETAAALDTSTEPAQFLQRFLNHEGAPAFVYMNELRSRLHPRIEDLSDVFSEMLVRNSEGQFVIRPVRRRAVEERLRNIERFQPMLKRFHEELTAWSEDLADPDRRHTNLKSMLADPGVAVFLASRDLTEDDEPDDEHFDDYFYLLEEATNDAPAGLILNAESEQLQEIESELRRYSAVRQNRSVLEKPLQELIDRLDQSDDLHVRLKAYLSTDLALMIMVREMDYSAITADDAAREWLSDLVTQGDNGKYTITSESPEDVKSRCEDFFREFRELRRRGRSLDEFASQLVDRNLAAAIRTLSGKLLLQELVENSAKRSDVDGLQLWVSAHFEETAEGLKLHDWADEEINAILHEAAELEEQFSKTDF